MTHAERISALPIKTLKLHQLQVVKGTKLAQMYQEDPTQIKLFTAQQYAEIVARFIRTARKDIFYDRFVSETPSSMLIAPAWGIKPQEWAKLLDKR